MFETHTLRLLFVCLKTKNFVEHASFFQKETNRKKARAQIFSWFTIQLSFTLGEPHHLQKFTDE